MSVPGRGHGGGPPRPGCATEKVGSTPCAAASFPVSPPASPLQNQVAPPVSGSAATTNNNRENIKVTRQELRKIRQRKDRFNHLVEKCFTKTCINRRKDMTCLCGTVACIYECEVNKLCITQ